MYEQIKAFFTPPEFETPEDNRRAGLLNALLIASGILTLLYLPIIALTNQDPLPGMLFLSLIIIIFVAMYLIFKRGYLNATAISLSTVIWLITAGASIYFEGVISPSYVSLFLIVYAAGLIINSTAAYMFAGLTIGFGVVLTLLENNQLLPSPLSETTATSFLAGFSINIILLAIFTGLTNKNTSIAFSKHKQDQKELEITNQDLIELQNSLEITINERTEELKRKNHILEAISSVVKGTSAQNLNLQELIDNTVDLISQELNYYHVGIFLVDNANEYAVLKASSSQGGKLMIERNHRLQVGKQGIVGFVTGIGQSRIAQGVSFDQYHATTTELPETRSEIALPLKAHGGIIGALNIYENKDNAFGEEEINILQTLADQVALAINNAELYQETQESLIEIQKAYGEYNQQAWLDTQRKRGLPSYRYSSSTKETSPVDTGNLPIIDSDGKREVPIIIRGQLIGSIDILKEENEEWTEEEQTLLSTMSDQIGTALDSARLFDETQERATTEKMIGDITTRIRESLDLHSILKNTALTIRESLDLPQVTIRLAEQSASTPTPELPEQPPEPTSNGSSSGPTSNGSSSE